MGVYQFLYISLCITIVVGFVTYKRRTGLLKLLPWFQLSMLICETIAKIINLQGKPNMLVYDVVTILETSFYGSLFYTFARNRVSKNVAITLFSIFLFTELVFWFNLDFIYTPGKYNLVSFYLSSLFLIIMAVHYLIASLNSDDIISFNRNPMIWISIGLMFYFGASSFFMVANYLDIQRINQKLIKHTVTLISACSLYICLIIAMMCKRYEK